MRDQRAPAHVSVHTFLRGIDGITPDPSTKFLESRSTLSSKTSGPRAFLYSSLVDVVVRCRFHLGVLIGYLTTRLTGLIPLPVLGLSTHSFVACKRKGAESWLISASRLWLMISSVASPALSIPVLTTRSFGLWALQRRRGVLAQDWLDQWFATPLKCFAEYSYPVLTLAGLDMATSQKGDLLT